MTLELPRRSFLAGLGALLAAPAIVKVANIMPVRQVIMAVDTAAGPDATTFWVDAVSGDLYTVRMETLRDLLLPGMRESVRGFYNRWPQGDWSSVYE